MNKENIKELLESGDISGAMDRLLEELETEGELHSSDDVEEVKADNETIYGDEEEKAEDVKEVIVEDEIKEDLVDEDIVEPANPEVELAKETYPEPEKEAPVGDLPEEEVEVKEIVKDPVAEEEAATEELGSDAVKNVVDEVNDLLDEPVVTEGFDKIFDLLSQINESLNQEKVHEVLSTEGREPKELAPEVKTDDVYSDDVHEEKDDVEVKELKENTETPTERFKKFLESAESCEKVDFKDVYPEDEREHSDELKDVKVETNDIYPADEHKEKDDVEGVMFEGFDYIDYEEYVELVEAWTPEKEVNKRTSDVSGWKTFWAWFIAGIPGMIIAHLLRLNRSKNDFKYSQLADKVSADAEGRELLAEIRKAINAKDKESLKDLKRQFKNRLDILQSELRYDRGKKLGGVQDKALQKASLAESDVRDVVEIVVEAAKLCGDNGVSATLDNITECAKTLFEAESDVRDVVEIVVEAAKLCGDNGVSATLDNITECAKTLFEAESVKIGDFVEKEYDVDAAIESSEMNGNDEEFDDYEDIVAEDRKVLKESVGYNSIREACLLDEEYFSEDTYTIQTATEKTKKLTEQVSLLLAREANDPLYEELLRTSLYAQRLQEACINKYLNEAAPKVEAIKAKRGK